MREVQQVRSLNFFRTKKLQAITKMHFKMIIKLPYRKKQQNFFLAKTAFSVVASDSLAALAIGGNPITSRGDGNPNSFGLLRITAYASTAPAKVNTATAVNELRHPIAAISITNGVVDIIAPILPTAIKIPE